MNTTNKHTYFTANCRGEIGCHDCDLGTARANCDAMREQYPDDEWEVLDAADDVK